MAPHTAKLNKMKKTQLVTMLNEVLQRIDVLEANAASGINAIREDIAANSAILEGPDKGGFAFGQLAQSIVAGLPMREFAIKATIGFIYGYTLGVVGTYVVGAMALVTMPAWIHFVLATLVVMALVYVAITTVWPVSNFTYNTVARTVNFLKRETLAAREWVEKTANDIRTENAAREAARATLN